jgi:pimeloyl-ACP methyl ester carboxylesterase
MRRGLGSSSRPDDGYTARQSGQDVLRVLETLKLEKPTLAGFSFGGQDLSWIGAEHPERVGALVYLDSAEDQRVWPFPKGFITDESHWRALLPKDPSEDLSSIAAFRAWQRTTHNMGFPESEVRQLYAINADGSLGEYKVPKQVRDAMFAGRINPDYQRIPLPVLAFYEMPTLLSEQLKRYRPQSREQAAALGMRYAISQIWPAVNSHALRSALPNAKIVFLAGGNNYIFLTNESEVVQETITFINALRQ